MKVLTLLALAALVLVVRADHNVDHHGRTADVVAKEFVHQGCYRDQPGANKRVLPNIFFKDASLTIDKCVVRCGMAGLPYAGIAYGNECYCGAHQPEEAAAADECTIDCAGADAEGAGGCGGNRNRAFSLYHAPGLGRRSKDRPLVCLAIMVKNEAHAIETTLDSVKGLVDNYVILDTGSEDLTPQIMIKSLATHGDDMIGALIEEPFIDYAASRNRNLDLCKERFNSVFTLVLSAEETIGDAAALRAFLEEMRFSEGDEHGAYPVRMNLEDGEPFDSVRVARVDAGWRYFGREHEYLTAPSKKFVELYRPTPEVMVRLPLARAKSRLHRKIDNPHEL
jgi:hypothetical protein